MNEGRKESLRGRNAVNAGGGKGSLRRNPACGGIPKGQDTVKDVNCHGRGKEMMGNDKDIDCGG